MKDYIVEEVREIRKLIELENKNNWELLELYFLKRQALRKDELYRGKPQSLPTRNVA